MPTVEFPRSGIREIEEIEPALTAALGAIYGGASLTPRAVLLHLRDNATRDDQLAAAAALQSVIATIDSRKLSPSQRRAQRSRAAQASLSQVDFQALEAQIDAANTTAQLKLLLTALLRLLWRMSAAQLLTDQDDPGE